MMFPKIRTLMWSNLFLPSRALLVLAFFPFPPCVLGLPVASSTGGVATISSAMSFTLCTTPSLERCCGPMFKDVPSARHSNPPLASTIEMHVFCVRATSLF